MSPEEAMAPAWARIILSLISVYAMYQLDQPMGGVRAIWSPTTMRNAFSAAPRAFFARSLTVYVPLMAIDPVIRPVFGSSMRPEGRPVAENSIGRSPVAGMV